MVVGRRRQGGVALIRRVVVRPFRCRQIGGRPPAAQSTSMCPARPPRSRHRTRRRRLIARSVVYVIVDVRRRACTLVNVRSRERLARHAWKKERRR